MSDIEIYKEALISIVKSYPDTDYYKTIIENIKKCNSIEELDLLYKIIDDWTES